MLTLLVPDLLPPIDASDAWRALRLPALEGWLARADAARAPCTGDAWLLREWGCEADAPVAALTLVADAGPREGVWLRADPVHQRVEGHALVLHDASVLDLAPEEVDAALAALNGFFARDGLEFVAPVRERWYARIPAGEEPASVPLDEAVGRNPFGMVPKGGVKLAWPSLFSEAQMLLANLAFNAEREAAGRPALNGLWFWGAGPLPARLPQPYARVLARDPLARGLCMATGSTPAEPPARLASLAGDRAEETLVVLDDLRVPLRRGDVAAWTQAARALDEAWFAALGDALHDVGHVRLVLPAARDTAVFDLRPAARWRFLRRARPLASHA